jgi:phage terminase large subunit-like protein
MISSSALHPDFPYILSGPIPKIRRWRKIKRENLTRAERAMAFIERHCVIPEGENVGKPLRLQPLQESFFYCVFDNPVSTRVAILSMARKNAKTATIALLILVYLVGPEAVENSRLSSGALSRKQASEVYNYAAKMAALSPTLSKLIRPIPSSKTLIGLLMNVEYQALAAEGATAHGGSPLVAVLDEAGQVRGPYNAFFEAITTSQGAYENPLEIWISTQAPTDGDLFNRLIDDAKAARDPSIVCHVYCADEDADLFDEMQWAKANPALGTIKSRSELVKGAEKAHRMPDAENTFRWLHLNQRITTHNPFISRSVWEENHDPNCNADAERAFLRGDVFCGLDLSQTTDLTAAIFAARYDGLWYIRSMFWMAEDLVEERSRADRVPYDLWAKQGFLLTTPGKSVALAYVAKQLADACAKIPNLRTVAFDRYRMPLLKHELDLIGADLPLSEFGQGYASMSPAVQATEEALLHGSVRHGNHPVLNMCASNAVVIKDPAGNRKLDKSKSTGRIDGMVSLVMAIGASSLQVEVKRPPANPARRGFISF